MGSADCSSDLLETMRYMSCEHKSGEGDVKTGFDLPVRMVWKADSTFEASRAEVSMKDKLFSADQHR